MAEPVRPGIEASQMADESQTSLVSTRDELDSVNTKGIKLSSLTRDDILSGINDSSESLSLYGDQAEQESPTTTGAPSTSQASKQSIPTISTTPAAGAAGSIQQPKRGSRFFGGGGADTKTSKLSQVMESADMETPKAEKGDPLAKKGAAMLGDGGELSQASTAKDEDGKSDVLSAGSGGRPGALRRLTSRLKRTISSKDTR